MPKPSRPKTGRTEHAAMPTPVVNRSLDLFQKGVAALQRHAYNDASLLFRSLLEDSSADHGVLDRARLYLGICERELLRQPAMPRTLEERLTAATAAINDDEVAKAETLARAVLAENPRHELALYLVAVVHARRRQPDQALAWLTKAVTASPEVRAQARHDQDFEVLRGNEEFQLLTDPPPSADNQHKPRRGRLEG